MKKLYILCLIWAGQHLGAQTEIDGIMMNKKQLCSGAIYEYSSWDNYWEGTFKRENLNFGTVSTQKIAVNCNYGISNKLNAIVSLPYVKTNASAGTMIGQKGVQDLSLFLKYMPYEKEFGNKIVSFYAIAGASTPVSDYVADYLPLSIGSRSKTLSIRGMGDLQWDKFFATISAAYIKRYNIEIDRNVYYTTSMHYTNQVDMPNMINGNARIGYRTSRLIAELLFDTSLTTGDTFDITTNNMPFPSNTMNMTKIGLNTKYTFKKMPELALIAGLNHVTSGRNVGQTDSFYGGVFYLIDFKSK